ncbi:hypothetical protein B0H11DRAFT_2354898 [Mycena galericulata]|nr:hypothetical protein B0H11DRAFT_2354898 [Mycena galericulata]
MNQVCALVGGTVVPPATSAEFNMDCSSVSDFYDVSRRIQPAGPHPDQRRMPRPLLPSRSRPQLYMHSLALRTKWRHLLLNNTYTSLVPFLLERPFDSSGFAVSFKSACTVDGLNGNSEQKRPQKLQDMPLQINLWKSKKCVYTPRPLPPRESISPSVPPPEPDSEVDMNDDTFLFFPPRGDNPGSAAVHLGAPTSVESDWDYDSELCTAENLQGSMDVDLLSETASEDRTKAIDVGDASNDFYGVLQPDNGDDPVLAKCANIRAMKLRKADAFSFRELTKSKLFQLATSSSSVGEMLSFHKPKLKHVQN